MKRQKNIEAQNEHASGPSDRSAKALEDALASLAKNPNDRTAGFIVAAMYLRQGDYDNAIKHCRAMIDQDALRVMATAYQELGRVDVAAVLYKAIILIFGNEVMFQDNVEAALISTLRADGRVEEAEAWTQRLARKTRTPPADTHAGEQRDP
jgi:tetratricopeptide (TPR) repeat protein